MIQIAVIGYGNVGQGVLSAIAEAPDMALCGVVRRDPQAACPTELLNTQIVADVLALPTRPDVAILCTPTRSVEEMALHCLQNGISTVDCFDMHQQIPALRQKLDSAAKASGARAVVSAGWDPGSDSMVRALFLAMAPKGITYTNFGPGMSMGHSVAIKAIDGVADAVSYTIPLGSGVHRRMCYVQVAPGGEQKEIKRRLLADDYFSHDETHVQFVPSVDAVRDQGHAVDLLRKGVSGVAQNQNLRFQMSINNPALTAQIMVSCARAALRQQPGAYTMIELPPVDLLPGTREEWVAALV